LRDKFTIMNFSENIDLRRNRKDKYLIMSDIKVYGLNKESKNTIIIFLIYPSSYISDSKNPFK